MCGNSLTSDGVKQLLFVLSHYWGNNLYSWYHIIHMNTVSELHLYLPKILLPSQLSEDLACYLPWIVMPSIGFYLVFPATFCYIETCFSILTITTTLLWSVEMKVYPVDILCLEETNDSLTLNHLSFSISLNNSLTDFLLFIFMASRSSWNPSEIQTGATYPKDREVGADFTVQCERTWMRGSKSWETTSPAGVKQAHLERTVRCSFFTYQFRSKHDIQKTNAKWCWGK